LLIPMVKLNIVSPLHNKLNRKPLAGAFLLSFLRPLE
jgi:hypothetical protein